MEISVFKQPYSSAKKVTIFTVVTLQLSSHLDPVNGDCEAVEAPCPFHNIGCPDGEVSNKYRENNIQYNEDVNKTAR